MDEKNTTEVEPAMRCEPAERGADAERASQDADEPQTNNDERTLEEAGYGYGV